MNTIAITTGVPARKTAMDTISIVFLAVLIFTWAPQHASSSSWRAVLKFGRTGGPRPVQDEDKLDLNQLFIEFHLPSHGDRPRASLKIGRQDLQYGEGTLLDVRDLNVRQSFDGIKLILRPKHWQVDLFAMRPALSNPGLFDDYPDHTQRLWGVYGTLPRFVHQLDAYYLGLDRKFARFAQGSGRDQRHTVGSLIHGGQGNFSYVGEGDLQFGKFGRGNILAWKYDQTLSYSFSHLKLRPVPSLLFAISSGDKNPANPDLQTFYPLFPKVFITASSMTAVL
jgi:hypothetical protein